MQLIKMKTRFTSAAPAVVLLIIFFFISSLEADDSFLAFDGLDPSFAINADGSIALVYQAFDKKRAFVKSIPLTEDKQDWSKISFVSERHTTGGICNVSASSYRSNVIGYIKRGDFLTATEDYESGNSETGSTKTPFNGTDTASVYSDFAFAADHFTTTELLHDLPYPWLDSHQDGFILQRFHKCGLSPNFRYMLYNFRYLSPALRKR